MKAHPKTKHGTFEVEGATAKDLFRAMASIQEVFSEEACGLCQQAVRLAVREVDGNEFFEYQCQNGSCGAFLSIGQSKKKPGELFPVRKLMPNGKPSFKSGSFGAHRGWTKYRGKDLEEAN